jgi:uncharacterized protein
MQTLIRGLYWAFFCYIAYCGLLYVFQRRLMYPAYLIQPGPIPESLVSKIERTWISTPFGKVECWFLRPTDYHSPRKAPLIIIAHGNAEIIDGLPDEFDWLTGRGFALLLVEYPGYGRSDGAPSQEHIADILTAAYDTIIRRPDIDPMQIILLGRSLGGGTICTLADQRPSAGLILISTFTDTTSFAKSYLAPGFLVRDTYNNKSVLERYSKPVLIIHGTRDKVVPYDHALRLSRAAKDATLVTYDCGHDDCPPDNGKFSEDLFLFFRKINIMPTGAVEKEKKD